MRSRSVEVGLLARAIIVLCALVAVAVPSAATSTNLEGKFVAVGTDVAASYPYAPDGLYVMNADGSGRRQITRSISDEQPHWSPDGTWIALVDTGDDPNQIEVVRGDGSGRRVLGPGNEVGGGLDAPSPWSPDATQLAWSGCGGLCVMQLASSTRRSVSLGGDDSSGFAWSPDGRSLAAVDGEGHLVVAPAGGGTVRVLSTDNAQEPAWSPDGTAVAFLEQSGRNYRLEVVAAAGGAVRQLAAAAGRPLWSPDGGSLLYSGVHDRAVRRIDLATGRNTVVAADGASPIWAPDDSGIAYTRTRWPAGGPNERDLWTANIDGSATHQVTTAFPSGVGYNVIDWTAGSVPTTPTTAPLLTLAPLAEKQTRWVDALAPAGQGAGVAYEEAGITCDPNALTTASLFHVWTPPATHVLTTQTPCGNYGAWGPFGLTKRLVGWTADVALSAVDERAFTAFARRGTSQNELARLTADSYDKRIGYVGAIGDLVGDGSQLVFETWGTTLRGKTALIVHRRLWHIVDRPGLLARGSRLPPDAGDAVAVDAGRIVLLAKHGLLLLATNGRVLLRIQTPRPDSAQIGGSLLGSISGRTLRVYSADQGRPRYQMKLADAAGPPKLLSIRNGYATYRTGIEIHLVRLHDATDRVLNLPGQAGPVDALLDTRGLFISYNRAYDTRPGRILYIPWSTITNGRHS